MSIELVRMNGKALVGNERVKGKVRDDGRKSRMFSQEMLWMHSWRELS